MIDQEHARKVLIVEDDDALRERLERAMQKRAFATLSASSISEGLAIIEVDAPDYAIVDLRLHDGSGLTLVEALEQRHPNTRAIILTGYGNIPTAVAAARLGAIDYIAKPASAEEIIDVLMTPKGEQPPAPTNPLSPNEARWEHIEHVFHEAGDNVSKAARLLKMHRRSLQRILRRYGVASDVAQ